MKWLLLAALVGIVVAQDEIVNEEFLNGYNKFTTKIYNEIKKKHTESFVVSPLSVDLIMALTHYGAVGTTAEQLQLGLSLPAHKTYLRQALVSLIPKLNVRESYTLKSANKIYIKEGYKLNTTYAAFAASVYNAEVSSINFDQKQVAAQIINDWVEDKTLKNIKNLLKTDDIVDDTQALLINTLYFHGEWIQKFNKFATEKAVFYLDNLAKTEVKLMSTESIFKYFEDVDAKFLELPYVGHDVTLTIILPIKNDGLANLENNIENVFHSPNYKRVTVKAKIPKLKVESEIEFKSILQSLGIIDAFTDNAQFPYIMEEKLKIDKVVQKAVIEINEEGTTAAAATAAIMPNLLSGAFNVEVKEFIADHPFIYVLKYHSVVLFIGRYTGK